MFGHLAGWDRICVTGPQRSGTTIATHMIAADTGHRVVDETDYGTDDDRAFRAVLANHRVVVQCPTMLRGLCDDPPAGTLIVLMRRPLDQIRASRDRIGWWPHETAMLERLGRPEARLRSDEIIYDYWDTHRPPDALEVPYGTLAAHRLWVPPAQRTHFAPKQVGPRVGV